MAAPNILIIMCDQLQAGVLGCYGGPVDTSNIDRLAQRGVRFTNAACPTPICSPSRASMITGVYPHTHGIVHNVNRIEYPAIDSPETEEGLRRNDVTTDGILHAAGYETHHYGKLHLLDDPLDHFPDMFGEHTHYPSVVQPEFEQARTRQREAWMDWYGWALAVEQSEHFREAVDSLGDKWSSRQYAEFIQKIGRLEMPPERTFDYMVAERVRQALRQTTDTPFMITCSFNWPHDPNVVPTPYYEMFDPAEIDLPESFETREPRFESQWSRQVVADLGDPGVREFMRIYYASVKLIDDLVGQILDDLEATGKADDTLVLFTADHGDMCGGHGMVWKSTDAFYEELVRVPMIFCYPKRIAPAELDTPVNLVDVMPTLLDFASQQAPEDIEGRSLEPVLTGAESPDDPGRMYTFCERLKPDTAHRRIARRPDDGAAMARSRRWKYCEYHDGQQQLFDLQEDPGETHNLAHDPAHADSKLQLSDALDAWLHTRPGR